MSARISIEIHHDHFVDFISFSVLRNTAFKKIFSAYETRKNLKENLTEFYFSRTQVLIDEALTADDYEMVDGDVIEAKFKALNSNNSTNNDLDSDNEAELIVTNESTKKHKKALRQLRDHNKSPTDEDKRETLPASTKKRKDAVITTNKAGWMCKVDSCKNVRGRDESFCDVHVVENNVTY